MEQAQPFHAQDTALVNGQEYRVIKLLGKGKGGYSYPAADGETLYYIDCECSAYSDEWNFENWGIQYWSKTPGFLKSFP